MLFFVSFEHILLFKWDKYNSFSVRAILWRLFGNFQLPKSFRWQFLEVSNAISGQKKLNLSIFVSFAPVLLFQSARYNSFFKWSVTSQTKFNSEIPIHIQSIWSLRGLDWMIHSQNPILWFFNFWKPNYGHFGTMFSPLWPKIEEMSGLQHLKWSLKVKYQLILS